MSMRRSKSLFGALFVSLCAFDCWCGWRAIAGRREAYAAAEQLAQSQRAAYQIERLRQAPVRVEDTIRSGESLAQLAESTAREIGLESARIVHIAPAAPRRIEGSAYLAQVTEIELREVTLRQLSELSLALPRKLPGIHVPSVVMRVPPGSGGEKPEQDQELWNVQLTLTSFVYVPSIPGAR